MLRHSVAGLIQRHIQATGTLQQYALNLCRATTHPAEFGITLDDVNIEALILAGVSPRGMSMLIRAAKVAAWFHGRDMLIPEDIHEVFAETIAHRVFFTPVYELRRSQVAAELMRQILRKVPAP